MPFDITRTELVWPGKYDEEGRGKEVERVSLPFQVIERVNESRATREAEKSRNPTLFDVWQGDSGETFEDGWRNKLIWGDNKLVMSSLLDQFAGKIDLIYIDPPFAVGADFALNVPVGDGDEELFKEQSLIEEKAYRDTWGLGLGSYIEMLADRFLLMRELLAPNASIWVHLDWHTGHYAKLLLDEVFGQENFVNEVVWHYRSFHGQVKSYFPKKHDTLFFYQRGERSYFELPRKDTPIEDLIDYRNWSKYIVNGDEIRGHNYPTDVRFKRNVDKWRRANPGREPTRDDILYTFQGQPEDDVWDIPYLDPKDKKERTYYATQKPQALLERVIRASCPAGGLVADFFVGSGTTAAAAESLGRRWIGCDLGRYAIHTTRKRLLDMEDVRPFEVLNLGKYERKYWAVSTFGDDLDDDGLISLYEYVAFVLKLYSATPAAGMQHLHGKVGSAFVHVGAVDSPVTIDEVVACVDEAVALKAKEVHVLGWEWEMGIHPITDIAKQRGVNVLLRQIPREVMEQQAAAKGDVEFFELAYLDVAIEPGKKKHEVVATLKNFVIPNPELVPDDVRSKIKKWSDYVDYWAVDWNFADDTFIQGWVTYRTRKDRALDLESDAHTYDGPGTHSVMVKVIDIFGNDTSKIIQVKVG